MADKDIVLNMSDEEFMKNYSGNIEAVTSEVNPEPEEEEVTDNDKVETDTVEDNSTNEPENNNNEDKSSSGSEEVQNNSEEDVEEDKKKVTSNTNKVEKVNVTNNSNSDTIPTKDNKELDYKALYEKIMAPFKADGKTVQLKDVNEAISLMQKGVNYTRKTQNLAKYQKSILSLENANLLDAQKLNNLINIYKGDKEAIKQLLAERKIDPMELSSNEYEDDQTSNYIPQNNLVDDNYVNFRNTLDEVKYTQEGQAVIQDLLGSDDRTKEEVYKDPRIVKLLVDHKQSGIYDTVMNEVNRRLTLGLIDSSTPLIYAYNQVGNELSAQLVQNKNRNYGSVPPSGSAVNAKPVPQPKPSQVNRGFTAANNAKARAAAMNRTAPVSNAPKKNPLSMSDEEFMKTFGGNY